MALPLLPFMIAASWGMGTDPESDPCSIRTDDVPCIHVGKCDAPIITEFGDFKVSNAVEDVPAVQSTNGNICYDSSGIHVFENATEAYIFSPYSTCNSEVILFLYYFTHCLKQPIKQVFIDSDVLEVFIAPVNSVSDNPEWYFELDASPSGAMWAGLIDNTKGNVSTCVSDSGCLAAGNLPCTGVASFPHNMTVTTTSGDGFWTTSLFIPWGIFAREFQFNDATGAWPTWRINFYRYDYPQGPNAAFSNYELTGWSPTHSPSFHEPARFGVLVLDP
jgi:hypothetical protein